MSVSAETPRISAGFITGSLWAGFASAVICYAEYLGMGALLGSYLLGHGDQAKSVGTLLVVASAIIGTLCLAARRLPFLAGPRGASMGMLVFALAWLQTQFPTTSSGQVMLLGCIMLGCACMLVVMCLPAVAKFFKELPTWLMPAFIYASAVSIIDGVVTKYLHHCILRDEATTWLIFLPAVLLGIAWPMLCKAMAARFAQSKAFKAEKAARALSGLALMLAGALAWITYQYSGLTYSEFGRCSTLGSVDLDVSVISTRVQSLLQHGNGSLTGWAYLMAFGWGCAVGIVAGVETKSTSDVLQSDWKRDLGNSLTRVNAGLVALTIPATGVVSSVSLSRTQTLQNFFPLNTVATIFHALCLCAIALLASQWLGQLPHIALAVLMTLVATQMLSEAVKKIWRNAYDPTGIPPEAVLGGLGFWLVLAISILTGYTILGLLIPAVLYFVLFYGRRSGPATQAN